MTHEEAIIEVIESISQAQAFYEDSITSETITHEIDWHKQLLAVRDFLLKHRRDYFCDLAYNSAEDTRQVENESRSESDEAK